VATIRSPPVVRLKYNYVSTFWSPGQSKVMSVYLKIVYSLSRCLGALTVLHLSLSMNSLNKTKTAVFTLLLHFLLPVDHITRNLFISTVAGVECLCGGRNMLHRTSSLVQFSILSGLSGLSNEVRCKWKLNTAYAGERGR